MGRSTENRQPQPGWVVLGAVATVAGVAVGLWEVLLQIDDSSADLETDEQTVAPGERDTTDPTREVYPGPPVTGSSSSVVEDVERETALESSLLVGDDSNNLNWSVVDLTPDIAAFGVNGEATSGRGFAFRLGGYSAQTEPPVVEAEFDLGEDYSALRALVGLTDNSEEDDPVQVEIVDAVSGEVLFSGTVAVGSPQELELSVADVLRVRVTVTGGTQFSSSWLTFSQPG